jgi:SpoVK/Ycf46/Vps4 family AAA+-type ATPase
MQADAAVAAALPRALHVLATLRVAAAEGPPCTDALAMQAWEAVYVVHGHRVVLEEATAREVLDPGGGGVGDDEGVLERRTRLLESLRVLEDGLLRGMDAAAEKMDLKPRLVRLAERLQLNEKELRAWVCIILSCTGVYGPADSMQSLMRQIMSFKGRSELYVLREFAGFESGAELLQFLSPGNAIMKQGLLEVDDEFSTSYSDCKFRAPREVLKALYGGHITLDEFMTVDGTALADVLSEEPGSVVDGNGIDVSGREDGDGDVIADDSGGDVRKKQDDMMGLLSELRFAEDGPTPAGGEGGADGVDAEEDADGDGEAGEITPYKSDMEYLEDGFNVIQEACKVYNFKEKPSEDDRYQSTKRPVEALMREAEAKQRKALSRFSRRLAKTRASSVPLPRLELLVDKLNLDHFERMTVLTLVGATLSQPVRKALRADPSSRYDGVSVSKLLRIHCGGELKEEIAARFHFYKRGRLVRSGCITVEAPYGLADLGESLCDLDHMVLDYVAGLKTEIDELMDSARCYTPKVTMDAVVLPKQMKELVLRQAENFELFRKLRKDVGLDDIVRYGKGLTMLFHGRSGTGKTLLANAIANHLGRKLLVVDFASLNNSKFSGAEAFKVIFRESTIHRAIVFFDECDEILESRDRGGKGTVALALREMETFDGILILASNRPQHLDEAVHRRISLSLEFTAPDVELRLDIWRKHIPKRMQLADDVDLGALSLEYELSGGLIKNAIMQALSSSVSRLRAEEKVPKQDMNPLGDFESASGMRVEDVVITMQDLRSACRLQARGHLKRVKLERRIIPVSGLETVVTSEGTLAQLRDVVMVEKVRGLMSTRWGFKSRMGRSNCVLLFGPQGCGKTFAAACIGFETGRPLQTVSMSELTAGAQIADFFGEASIAGAIIVVEQAEQLLLEVAKTDNAASPGLELLYHVQEYNGLVVLCCTTVTSPSNAGWDVFQPVPTRLASLLSYVIVLERPSTEARLRLWRQLMPKAMPLDDAVDAKLPEIAEMHEFTGARISACIRRAAAAAALRTNRAALGEAGRGETNVARAANAKVTLEDIVGSCEAERLMETAAGGSQYWGNLYV